MELSATERARLIKALMSASSSLYNLIQCVDEKTRVGAEKSVQETISECDALVRDLGFAPSSWNPISAAMLDRKARGE